MVPAMREKARRSFINQLDRDVIMSRHFEEPKEMGDLLCGLIFIGGNLSLLLTALAFFMQDARSFVLFGASWLGSMILFWFIHSWVYADEGPTHPCHPFGSEHSSLSINQGTELEERTSWRMPERRPCPNCHGNGRCMACGGCGIAGGYLVARHPNIDPKPKCHSCGSTGICGRCGGTG